MKDIKIEYEGKRFKIAYFDCVSDDELFTKDILFRKISALVLDYFAEKEKKKQREKEIEDYVSKPQEKEIYYQKKAFYVPLTEELEGVIDLNKKVDERLRKIVLEEIGKREKEIFKKFNESFEGERE